MGGIYGCGCKEVYRFPHTIYLSLLLLYLFFLQYIASLLFVHLKKCFLFLILCAYCLAGYIYCTAQ